MIVTAIQHERPHCHENVRFKLAERREVIEEKSNFTYLNPIQVIDNYKNMAVEEISCYTDYAFLKR